MRNLDILAAENGEHVRVLLCGEEQSYVVSCQHFRMPYPVASDLLAELQPVPAETYSVFVLDEDITNRQREGRNRKLDLIAPLLEDACMRYCPVCYQEDLQLYGEPYWHRSHQLPDMQICTKHRCWLVDTDVTYNSARQQELFPATFTMQLKKLPAEPVPDCLLALDLLLQDTLDSNFDYRDGSVYHAVLDSALRSRGWRSLTGGRTYATKIETALLNLYGSYIPTADLSTKQLHATLCSKSVALRYVLQLAVLLGLSLHDLLHAPDAVPDYKAEMKAMYQSGASMYHIAQLYGIDTPTAAV